MDPVGEMLNLRAGTAPYGADSGSSPPVCASVLPGQGLYLGGGNHPGDMVHVWRGAGRFAHPLRHVPGSPRPLWGPPYYTQSSDPITELACVCSCYTCACFAVSSLGTAGLHGQLSWRRVTGASLLLGWEHDHGQRALAKSSRRCPASEGPA